MQQTVSYDPATLNEMCRRLAESFQSVDRYRTPTPDRYVVIDLTVESWHVVLTKMLIGKYMSWYYNVGLCGLVGSLGQVSNSTRSIAKAFGCDKFVGIVDSAQKLINETPDFNPRYHALLATLPKSGAELRQAINTLMIEGLQVGDLIYDSYLRNNGCPTIDTLTPQLANLIGDAYARRLFSRDFFDRHQVAAMASAHVVYTGVGIFAREALSRGISVTQDLSLNPFRIKRYLDFSHAREATTQFNVAEVDAVWRTDRDAAVAAGRRYVEGRMGGAVNLAHDDTKHGPFGSDKKAYDHDSLCRLWGWDPAKPIISVMAHVFFESPHAVGRGLYCDYVEWLRDTLATAAETTDCNWIIKFHPDQRYFDQQAVNNPLFVPQDVLRKRLFEGFEGAGHVRISPDDMNTAALIRLSRAMVTQHGTAGYEFAANGVPVIVTARAPYAGLGFTIEPRSREAYRETLRTAHTLAPLEQEARERALTFIHMFIERSRVATELLPDLGAQGFWAPQFMPEVLTEVAARATTFRPEDDPLYHAIRRMLRLEHSGLNLPD